MGDWLTLGHTAKLLGVSANRIRHLAREREIIALRTEGSKEYRVPAVCVQDGEILKGLAGALISLGDAGYDEQESALWLFVDDDVLGGRPIDSLVANRRKEVGRRIRMLGF